MSFMNYNKINLNSVKSIELISEDSKEWRKFKKRMYSNNKKTEGEKERESYIQSYPQEFHEFKRRYENILLKGPRNVARELEEKYISKKTCGTCFHSRNDKYRSGEEFLVCWENSRGKRPKKITKHSQACNKYRTDKIIEKENYQLNLPFILRDLKESNRLESRARKIAAFENLDKIESFSSMRLKAFLHDLGSTEVKEWKTNNNKNAYLFESKVRKKLEKKFNSKNRVIKIKRKNKKTTYKEMDYHGITTITQEKFPFVAEIFTYRNTKKKEKQVTNYADMLEKIYNRPVGRILITDSHNSKEDLDCYRVEKIIKQDVLTPPGDVPCYKIKRGSL